MINSTRLVPLLVDLGAAIVPMLVVAMLTWRLVWPRWKLAGKLLLHPCIYGVFSLWIGHWSVLLAWLHQGAGLAGHIWFSRKYGFTWYSVEDPERYVRLSQTALGLAPKGSSE